MTVHVGAKCRNRKRDTLFSFVLLVFFFFFCLSFTWHV